MKTENLERSLREHSFCSGFEPRTVSFLAGCTKNLRFAAGSHVFREGGSADAMYLLRSGTVSLEVHLPGRGALTVETLTGTDVMGWSALYPPHRWSVDCRVIEPVLAFAVDAACLRDKLAADSAFGYAITRQLLGEVHRRLTRARLQQLDVYRAELQREAPRETEVSK